jgi:hypothetical protein
VNRVSSPSVLSFDVFMQKRGPLEAVADSIALGRIVLGVAIAGGAAGLASFALYDTKEQA